MPAKTKTRRPSVNAAKKKVAAANRAVDKARGRLTTAKGELCDAEKRAKTRQMRGGRKKK